MHAVGLGEALSVRASDINQTSTVPAAVPGTHVENFCRQRRTSGPGRRRERGIREGEEKRKKITRADVLKRPSARSQADTHARRTVFI